MKNAELITELRELAEALKKRQAEYVDGFQVSPSDHESLEAAHAMACAADALEAADGGVDAD